MNHIITIVMTILVMALFISSFEGTASFEFTAFVAIAYTIWLVWSTFKTIFDADKRAKKKALDEQKPSAESNTYTISISPSQELAECEDTTAYFQKEAEKEAAAEFLQYKLEKIDNALFKRNYTKAMELLHEMLEETNPERDAIARHFTLLKILEKLYSIREENPIVYDLCLQICDMDFQNMKNFIKACNEDYSKPATSTERLDDPLCLVTPTRAAIIMEKKGDLVSAIAICDLAIRWNSWDNGKKSFEIRKARLEKKLSSAMQD